MTVFHSLVDLSELQELGEILCHLLHRRVVAMPVIRGEDDARGNVKQIRVVHSRGLSSACRQAWKAYLCKVEEERLDRGQHLHNSLDDLAPAVT